jgi:sulfide dehydrogenase cytochrome subunit
MQSKTLLAAAAAGVAAFVAGPAPAHAQTAPDTARFVAASCTNCHGTFGVAKGAMPSLAGLSKERIAETMRAFRDGKRPATVMQQIAKGYTDQQIDMAAEYFASQKLR